MDWNDNQDEVGLHPGRATLASAAAAYLGMGLTNVKSAASGTGAIQSVDRVIGLGLICHFNECKPS